MSKTNPLIALAGNPNVGKTTLFNALTGSRQTVGNWPGVTVEHKQGYYLYKGRRFEVIDLPGIYSLSASSPDEQVAQNFLLQKKPDLVINIADASNLERNLYLTVQLMELGSPLLLLLSMPDIAERNEVFIEYGHLAGHLGFDVHPLVLNRRFDVARLYYLIEARLEEEQQPSQIVYDEVVEQHLSALRELLEAEGKANPEFMGQWGSLPRDWLALKLLDGDPGMAAALRTETRAEVGKHVHAVEKHRGQAASAVLADDRYGFIRGLVKDVVKRKPHQRFTYSDRIDLVALNGFWGLPIFLVVMYLVFLLAVRASAPLIGWIDAGLSWLLVEKWGSLLAGIGLPGWLAFMLSEALGGGIVTIGTFIPPIFFIFASLSVLEDSGYMARAAFIADKFMRRIGLPGKAFIPLLVGFGCTVPAIMATRTLESRRDRVFASLLTPFMSCGAKLPVYTFLAMLFFPRRADLAIFGLYLFGVVMAMLFGLLLKKTIFRTQPGNFVMELPPYHLPTLNAIAMHTWHRLKDFVLRAGKTILLVIVVMNLLQVVSFPDPFGPEGARTTPLEAGGRLITPLLSPMGIDGDNWQATVALLTGLFAKEAIVGTLQGLYQTGEASGLQTNIRKGFGSLAAVIAYLVFVLLYSPCAATLALLFREHGRRWALFAFFYLTLLAFLVATVVYQLLAFSAASWLWLALAAGLFALLYLNLRRIGRTHVFPS
jgi:ferrous iron transport protein B